MFNKILNLFRKQKAASENEKKLRASGKAIYFGFDDCVIKSFNSIEEDVFSIPSKIEMLDALAGRDAGDQTKPEVCYIFCEVAIEGRSVRFVSPPLQKDKTVLAFLLHERGGLNVLVDPGNLDIYLFDLSFLK